MQETSTKADKIKKAAEMIHIERSDFMPSRIGGKEAWLYPVESRHTSVLQISGLGGRFAEAIYLIQKLEETNGLKLMRPHPHHLEEILKSEQNARFLRDFPSYCSVWSPIVVIPQAEGKSISRVVQSVELKENYDLDVEPIVLMENGTNITPTHSNNSPRNQEFYNLGEPVDLQGVKIEKGILSSTRTIELYAVKNRVANKKISYIEATNPLNVVNDLSVPIIAVEKP